MPIRNRLSANLPELPGLSSDPEEILSRMIEQYETAHREQTGNPVTLASGDPIRIWLYTISLNQYLLENLVKFYASQNFLAYAQGEYLDHISATRGGPERAGSTPAIVTMRFAFSTPLTQTEVIPDGTRVTAEGSGLFFAVRESHTLTVGITEWVGVFTCQTSGIAGNGFLPGQIATLVDPLLYVQGVVNIDPSQGGADTEDDGRYAERVFLSPEGYAVAGPQLAYEYLAKSFSAAIEDVKVYSPEPGHVYIAPLLRGGEIPGDAFLSELLAALSAKDKRPLTDYVHTVAPEIVPFDISLTYYLHTTQMGEREAIRQAVERSVQDYIDWQRAKLGRDIDPHELIRLARNAGAGRLEVTAPAYTEVGPYGVGIAKEVQVRFGGLEDE